MQPRESHASRVVVPGNLKETEGGAQTKTKTREDGQSGEQRKFVPVQPAEEQS